MPRIVLAFGAVWGLCGVAAGALFDHALASHMTRGAEVALRYHQLYAVLIVVLGLSLNDESRRVLRIPALLFIAGSLVFCGSLYAAALTGIFMFNYGTPFGGILLMAGWAALGIATLRMR